MAAPNPAAPLRPHPLRQPWFRRLWIGRTISLLGDQCYFVALPWLVLQLTGSALAMGTVLMAAAVPRVVLMLLGGAISDRVSARRVMMAAAAARALLVAAVGGLLSLHRLRLADLYLLAFCFGVADAFGLPAGSAYLPAIVEPEQLVAANSVQQATVQATSLAGPAPAGWVMAAWGTAWAFYLDAISFLFIIGALMGLPDPPLRPKIAAAKRASMLASVGEGLRHVRGDAPLTAFMLLAAMINFCVAGPIGVGLAYLAKVRFNSAVAYGALVAVASGGGLLGTLLAGTLRVRRRGLLLLGVSAAMAGCIAPLGALASGWAIGILLLAIGLAGGVVNVHIAAWIQQRIPAQVRGRVMSVLMLATLGLMPISLALAGWLAAWSLSGLFALSGAGLMVTAAGAAGVRRVRAIE